MLLSYYTSSLFIMSRINDYTSDSESPPLFSLFLMIKSNLTIRFSKFNVYCFSKLLSYQLKVLPWIMERGFSLTPNNSEY